MGYELRADETLADGLRRVADEQLADAGQRLDATDGDPGTAIHETRKRLKQVRAVLRLARPRLPKGAYRREAERFRDLGRRLSALRDAQVALETFEAVAGEGRRSPVGRRRVRRLLAARRDRELAAALAPQVLAALREGVADGRRRVVEWPLPEDGFDLVAPGLTRTVRQGRRRLREALADPSRAALHELRKRVKDRWYHVRLFRGVAPATLGDEARRWEELSDLLGLDQDVANLLPALPPSARRRLRRRLRRPAAARVARALALASELYAEKPRAAAARYRALWEGAADA